MAELQERDRMQCRSCGQDERASEGYPCVSCQTFLCVRCMFKGIVRCAACEAQAKPAKENVPVPAPTPTVSKIHWPGH
jgi:hypothetical protein